MKRCDSSGWLRAHLRVHRILLRLVRCSLVVKQRGHHERREDGAWAVHHEALCNERRLHDLSELDSRRRRVEDEAEAGDRARGQHFEIVPKEKLKERTFALRRNLPRTYRLGWLRTPPWVGQSFPHWALG